MENRIYQPQVRLQALLDSPLCGGESYQFGFYDAGILRQVLDTVGSGGYKVWTLPIPQNNLEFERAKQLVNDPKVQYSLVDKDKIVFVVVEDSPGWMSVTDKLGYEVMSGPKTNKRLKSFHRPTLLNAHFDHLNIKFVEPTDYSRYNFIDENDDWGVSSQFRNPEITERLLDGGFVISRRLVQEAVKNLPMYNPDNSIDNQDYYYDPYIRKHLTTDLLNASVFNARIIFADGFIKGNAFVADLPEGVDVITSRTNVKKEIRYTQGFRFLAEPQGPKSRVTTDDQTVVNFPKLFRKSDMTMWLAEEYKKMYADATNGNLLTNWKYIYQRTWRDKDNLDDNEARARMAYVGYRWTAAGFKITESPWLFETVSISHAKPLLNRIPIPCSVYEQIVPESLVRMAGYDVEIEEGTIIRINELGVHVVNDIDWLEMYESHGGHDQDDFFKIFYREIEGGNNHGEKMVIAIRSPNGHGEYSTFYYVEGSWSPTWHKADGTEIKFPKINGRNWPKRLSESIAFNKVTYTKLPSANLPKAHRSGPYTQSDVIRDIIIAMAGGNVGGFVNASMFHSSVIGKHRPVQLCSLEDAIDKCINPDNAQDVMAIDAEANTIMREVLDSKKPIDEFLWNDRGSNRFLKENETVELYQGKLSQLFDLRYTSYNNYVEQIRSWSQENARPSDIIHTLGNRMYGFAISALRAFRVQLFRNDNDDQTRSSGGIQRNTWENVYQSIVDKINSYERMQDKLDFTLALYSATIQIPTSRGNITDQIVMNRFVYPYLEAALQYYGIANIPVYDNRNGSLKIQIMKNDEWYWPDSNGVNQRYTTPFEFQQAHAEDSPVIFTMPPAPPSTLTHSRM